MAQRNSPSGRRPPSGRSSGPGRPAGARGNGAGRPGAGRSTRPAGSSSSSKNTKKNKKGRSIVNQRQTPWGLISVIGGLVVLAVAVALIVVFSTHHSSTPQSSGPGPAAQIIPSTPTGAVTKEAAVKRVKNTTGIKGVIAYDTDGWPGNGDPHPGALQHVHVTGPVDYSLTPPAGGPHNAEWMNAGVYTKPVPAERAVHNLEHGAVWITYRPDLPKSEVAQLRAFVGKQSYISESAATGISGQANRYMDLTPWTSNSLPAPIVMSSWGYQLYLSSPTDPRMQTFVNTFRNSSKYTPEYGSPVDGVPVQIGGRPAYDGGKKANPAGSGT